MVSAGETTDVRAFWVWRGGQKPQLLHIWLDLGLLNGVFAIGGWEQALGMSWESWAGYKKPWGRQLGWKGVWVVSVLLFSS